MQPMAVIFDMDGVLIDSYEAHLASWNRMLADRGLSMSPEQFAETFGQTSREIIRANWPDQAGDPETVARWDAEKEAHYRQILQEAFPTMPGAGELLEQLDRAGFALAVGSSGPPENVQVCLDNLPGGDRFQAAVTGRDVTHGKPHPEVFLKAAEKLDVAPGRCAVIEDALAGLEAASRAGMVAVALTGTSPPEQLAEKARAVVDSLEKLGPDRLGAWIAENDPEAGRP
jgi:beta-phosphoglucomutase